MAKSQADGAPRAYTFEVKLKGYIKASGFSQAAVARKLGYSPSTLTKWLNDTNQIPYNVVFELGNCLGLTPPQCAELCTLAGYTAPPSIAEPEC